MANDGAELSPVRVESIWRQVIDVYRGGILADWYVLPTAIVPDPPLISARDAKNKFGRR